MLDPLLILRDRFARALAQAYPEHAGADPLLAASKNPKLGDYQCNAAMSLGKALGKNPREVAQQIAEKVDLGGLADPLTPASIAGPGFINITVRADALGGLLAALDRPDLGLPVLEGREKQKIVVDLCGVNLAKQMHIGHLRSTVIGDTIARVLARVGHEVVRQNHVGDWGLPIAMVTAKLIELEAAGRLDLSTITLDDLDAYYKQAKKDCDADEAGLAYAARWHMGPKILAELEAANEQPLANLARARATLVKLQSGDAGVRRVWKRIFEVTMGACLATCARLNADVRDEHTAGESFYEDKLAPLVARLKAGGVAVMSEGALVIRLDDAGIAEPLIVQKSDGGFLYATTDLAAIEHRAGTLGAQRVIYCVDSRQSLHFAQVFAAAGKAGLSRGAALEHAAFGSILGEDGRPFKSRSGESVRLMDVIDEAVSRAAAEVRRRSPELDEQGVGTIADAVALAAIRYTDLSSERVKDYVFSLERMVKFEGDTGPYMLYAVARIRSIFRKANLRPGDVPAGAIDVKAPAEKSLALMLLRYPQCVRDVERTLEPHRLCAYLYELATSFSVFFDQCPVLAAGDEATKLSRLRLCRLSERVLADGLGLLGLKTLERM